MARYYRPEKTVDVFKIKHSKVTLADQAPGAPAEELIGYPGENMVIDNARIYIMSDEELTSEGYLPEDDDDDDEIVYTGCACHS